QGRRRSGQPRSKTAFQRALKESTERSATSLTVVLVNDLRLDATARRDVISLTRRPGANSGVLLAVTNRRAATSGATTRRGTRGARGDLCAVLDEWRQCASQLRGVLGRKVDLIGTAIQAELHSLGRLRAIEVIENLDYRCARHFYSSQLLHT